MTVSQRPSSGAQRPFFDVGAVGQVLRTSDDADTAGGFPPDFEIFVDLFAGGGGASEGIEQATGRRVDIAVNHDPVALSMHQANHPGTLHYVSDVFEVDPVDACGDFDARRPLGVVRLQALQQGQGRQAGRQEDPQPRLGGDQVGQGEAAARHLCRERRGVPDVGPAW
jgi:hypothetical protein